MMNLQNSFQRSAAPQDENVSFPAHTRDYTRLHFRWRSAHFSINSYDHEAALSLELVLIWRRRDPL